MRQIRHHGLRVFEIEMLGKPHAARLDGTSRIEARGPGSQVKSAARVEAGKKIGGRKAPLIVAHVGADGERSAGSFAEFGRIAPADPVDGAYRFDADVRVQFAG